MGMHSPGNRDGYSAKSISLSLCKKSGQIYKSTFGGSLGLKAFMESNGTLGILPIKRDSKE